VETSRGASTSMGLLLFGAADWRWEFWGKLLFRWANRKIEDR